MSMGASEERSSASGMIFFIEAVSSFEVISLMSESR